MKNDPLDQIWPAKEFLAIKQPPPIVGKSRVPDMNTEPSPYGPDKAQAFDYFYVRCEKILATDFPIEVKINFCRKRIRQYQSYFTEYYEAGEKMLIELGHQQASKVDRIKEKPKTVLPWKKTQPELVRMINYLVENNYIDRPNWSDVEKIFDEKNLPEVAGKLEAPQQKPNIDRTKSITVNLGSAIMGQGKQTYES